MKVLSEGKKNLPQSINPLSPCSSTIWRGHTGRQKKSVVDGLSSQETSREQRAIYTQEWICSKFPFFPVYTTCMVASSSQTTTLPFLIAPKPISVHYTDERRHITHINCADTAYTSIPYTPPLHSMQHALSSTHTKLGDQIIWSSQTRFGGGGMNVAAVAEGESGEMLTPLPSVIWMKAAITSRSGSFRSRGQHSYLAKLGCKKWKILIMISPLPFNRPGANAEKKER